MSIVEDFISPASYLRNLPVGGAVSMRCNIPRDYLGLYPFDSMHEFRSAVKWGDCRSEPYLSRVEEQAATEQMTRAMNSGSQTVLKPGDQVLYEKYGTTPVDLDGADLVLVRESDILGWKN